MSRKIKTARGRIIDMGALAARNEQVKAVGNILMNARGDRLNPDGSVRITAEELARMDQDRKSPPTTAGISDPKPVSASQPKPAAKTKPQPDPVAPLDEYNDSRLTTANDGEGEDTGYPAPEAVSKITKTRDDGTRYMEIEYDDGSIETLELNEE